MSGQIVHTDNFVADAAQFILEMAKRSLAERGEFRVALSGGNTPRPIYSEWARAAGDLPWNRIVFTFGDERCVPPDHKDSNYRMARESLFQPANVPDECVLRMRGELEPQAGAQDYEDQLRVYAERDGEQSYVHDLVLLGLGDDGHTASLFPGTAALENTTRMVVPNFVPKFDSWRLTMTFSVINQARSVCFLIGAGKDSQLINRVVRGDSEYPAAAVRPSSGNLTWIVAEKA
jgi:6-phosphogluconolactonase